MKKYSRRTVLVANILGLLSLFYSGCASGVTRAPNEPAASFKLSEGKKIAEVKVALTPEMKEKLKDSLKFDEEALRRHIEMALSGYSVYDASKKGEMPTLDILVTNVRVRSTFNAVMWGFMAGSDQIEGTVVIKDPTGNKLDSFTVSTSYALGGWGGGQDSMRMDWLYEAFSKETVKELTGKDAAEPGKQAAVVAPTPAEPAKETAGTK